MATAALVLTGLTRPVAQFQARSALSGAGFTTSESERLVNHPVRRRIIMLLMVTGSAGLPLVTALIFLIVVNASGGGLTWWSGGGLIVGLVAIYYGAQSVWIERWMSRLIERMLQRYTDLDTRDYAGLLRLRGDYTVSEMAVEEGDWLAGRALMDAGLTREGLLVLGIVRNDGAFIGAPRGDTVINEGNTLLIYGRDSAIKSLDDRRAGLGGQLQHLDAVAQAQQAREEELAADLEQKEAEEEAAAEEAAAEEEAGEGAPRASEEEEDVEERRARRADLMAMVGGRGEEG